MKGQIALFMLTKSVLGETHGFPRYPRKHPPSLQKKEEAKRSNQRASAATGFVLSVLGKPTLKAAIGSPENRSQTPRSPKPWDSHPSLSKKKGQIALFMLTKFSMIFFIILLATVMVSFTETEKKGVCDVQANAVAFAIASTINNVINSPAEDERKVIPLQPVLSSGKRDFERYWIILTNVPSEKKSKAGSITVNVRTQSTCEGMARASYDESITLDRALQPKKAFYLFPSNVTERDYYFVLVKCRPKKPGMGDYLFIQECRSSLGVEASPDKCLPLNEQRVEQCCGWLPNTANPSDQPKCQ